MISQQQIALVQNTWKQVVPISAQAAELFYGRLFQTDPAARALFKGDMKEQGRKLMAMINVAVTGIGRLDQIVPAVQALGRRHKGYQVQDAQYATVGAALLWTLEQGLGPAFTPEVKEAWAQTYDLLAKTMQEAAAAA